MVNDITEEVLYNPVHFRILKDMVAHEYSFRSREDWAESRPTGNSEDIHFYTKRLKSEAGTVMRFSVASLITLAA